MIAYLKGKIINKGQGFIILGVRDVGYKVHVNPTQYAEISIKEEYRPIRHRTSSPLNLH